MLGNWESPTALDTLIIGQMEDHLNLVAPRINMVAVPMEGPTYTMLNLLTPINFWQKNVLTTNPIPVETVTTMLPRVWECSTKTQSK